MQLNITARHLELTPALSEYVRRKVEKAERYFDSIIWAQAILAVEKHRHIAEIVVHTPGNTFRTKGEAGDLYSAVDLAAHKLDVHLTRVKDRKRGHHGKGGTRLPEELLAAVSGPLPAGVPGASRPDALPAAVAERKSVSLEPRSLTEAMRELKRNGESFLLFLNERTNRINLLYRKNGRSYGLIEGVE